MAFDALKVKNDIVKWIRDWFEINGKGCKGVVGISGGKDSTAMLLRMLEEGMPVDIIIFCDTGLEFDEMYKHIDKLEEYIAQKIAF